MRVFKLLLEVPLIGTCVYIANCYVFSGDREASIRFAPFTAWCRALAFPLAFATFLAGVVLWPLVKRLVFLHQLTTDGLTTFAKAPGELIVSVVPSLLGFGIGVYALIFGLASPIVRELEKSIAELKEAKVRSQGSVLVINADLAYPLMVLLAVLSLGVFQKGNDSVELLVATWIAFWYALAVTLQVIGVLFGLGDHSLLDKLSDATGGSQDSRQADDVDQSQK